MWQQSVLCLANCRLQAGQIITRLKVAAFSKNDISALFPETPREFAHEKSTPRCRSPHSPTPGRAAWWAARRCGFSNIAALTIPGAGQIIAAGPIIAWLSGAAVEPAAGGIAARLIALGITELAARRYESQIRDRNILISVQIENSEQIIQAEKIFKDSGAQDVCTTGESMRLSAIPRLQNLGAMPNTPAL